MIDVGCTVDRLIRQRDVVEREIVNLQQQQPTTPDDADSQQAASDHDKASFNHA